MLSLLLIISFVMASPTTARDKQSDAGSRLILVTGVTGKQGGAVARELLMRGYRLRGLSRNPKSNKAKALSAMGIEIVQGDFDDPASLDAALAGVYGAYSVQQWWGVGIEVEIRQGKAFADAAKKAGIQHFVYSSVAAAEQSSGIAHFESKFVIEQHIRSIGLPYTILRPVLFMENWERTRDKIMAGTLGGPYAPGKRLQVVAVRDIGRFAAEAFDDPQTWIDQALDIASDEKTMQEFAATFSQVLQRPVSYKQIPFEKIQQSTTAEMATMYRWIMQTGFSVNLQALRSRYPWLTTQEKYLRLNKWDGRN